MLFEMIESMINEMIEEFQCIFCLFLYSINSRGRISCSLEEYLDHIHYLQDIFLLNVDSLNCVLKDQLMNRLLIPVYVFSIIQREKFARIIVKMKINVKRQLFFVFLGSTNNVRSIFCSIFPR